MFIARSSTLLVVTRNTPGVSLLAASVAYLGPGLRTRLTRFAGLVLAALGLLVWSAGLAQVPASGAAGDAASRAGNYFDASTDVARFLRAELLDVRLVALTVVGVGLSLFAAGRPVPAGRRYVRPFGYAVVLFGANAVWTQLPDAPVLLTAGSTALLLAVVLAVVERFADGPGGGEPSALPALLATGTVLALTYLASAESHIQPFLPGSHVALVVVARELGLVAAVVAACAVGHRRFGLRAVAGTVVIAVGAVVFPLAMQEDAIPGPVAQLLIGLTGAALLALVWSGLAAGGRAVQVAGALVAGLVGWAAMYLLVLPGAFLVYGIQPLAGVSNDDVGFPAYGVGLVYGLVLVGVHRFVRRRSR